MTHIFSPALFNPLLKTENATASEVYTFSLKEKLLCETDLRNQKSYGLRYSRQGGHVKGDREQAAPGHFRKILVP